MAPLRRLVSLVFCISVIFDVDKGINSGFRPTVSFRSPQNSNATFRACILRKEYTYKNHITW